MFLWFTVYKTSRLGQTDLVFGLRSEFISRCVREGLQVSMYTAG